MGRVQETICDIMIERVQARRDAGEKVVAPWRQTWDPKLGMPRNLVSGHAYRGWNIWMTLMQGYESPFWLTLGQIRKLGGTIKEATNGSTYKLRDGTEVPAGEPYTPIFFWWFPDPNKPEDVGRFAFCKFYKVWNVAQVSGIDGHPNLVIGDGEKFDPIAEAEGLVKGFPVAPEVLHGGAKACYVPSTDTVRIPARDAFESPEAYYRVLFHELAHSTGHRKRLERDGVVNPIKYASHEYSEEELIAEMGASMLSGFAGIGTEDADANSAAYLDFWLKKLKQEPNMLMAAGGAAQKAVDHIRGISWEKAAKKAA